MRYIIKSVVFIQCLVVLTSCNLFGYDLQQDYEYNSTIANPQTNKTVLDFMNSRKDIFSSMLQAIEYTKLDTLYTKSNNTYLLLTNYALATLTNANSYFYKNKVKNPANLSQLISGSKWSDYDTLKVREFLKYHVVKGTYNYKQLNEARVWAQTYASGDTCKMSFVLTNDRYASLYIQNNLTNTAYESIKPRTSGLECLNSGAVHVMDKYINPPTKIQLGIK
jgi:uncharacterized surface protein with fasciclin (FAS1) repeats